MEVQTLKMDKDVAREAWKDYRRHLHYEKPVNDAIASAYYQISQGKMVIRAIASLTAAGVGPDGLPKLAVCNADARQATVTIRDDGSAHMHDRDASSWRNTDGFRRHFQFPARSFPVPTARSWRAGNALVPTVPLDLRPKRGLENYHVLWEADWKPVVSRDPYLLRRIDKSDLWVVLAAWDLSEVEQAVLQYRATP